ncbi:MAG: histidine triad nucleotide-binding protein [Eubacteriales bacterium]|nr:histidine triad nucleotide-binding protein [Eubacteriales bacterium]
MSDCLFCKIVAGDIPSAKVYEDEFCYAFRDINPQAPTHVLVVSKAHVANLTEAAALPDNALAAMLRAIPKIAAQEKLEKGYRVVSNCGPDACQSVPHLHFHILGGRQMADEMA